MVTKILITFGRNVQEILEKSLRNGGETEKVFEKLGSFKNISYNFLKNFDPNFLKFLRNRRNFKKIS